MPPHSIPMFLLALAILQGLCLLLARGLGQRLEARAMALGLLVPLALLAPWLCNGPLLAPTDAMRGALPGMLPQSPAHTSHIILSDTLYQFVPWETEVRHSLRHRRLPLWSDLLDGGSSPWLNPQAGVLSPLAMLARPLPLQSFFLVTLYLKALLALEGTWLLARRLGASRIAAMMAAVSFALGGGVMAWGLFPHTATVAWVPWLTLGAICLCRRPRPASIAATACITAMLLLSGHPETALAGGLFAAFVALWLRRRGRNLAHGLARALAAAGLAALLGCGLAAPRILPFLKAVPDSQRARDMSQATPPKHETRWSEPWTWFAPQSVAFLRAPAHPQTFGLPYSDDFHGPYDWPDALSGYAGLAAFAGALVALFARRGRLARPFLCFAALAFLLVAGFLPFLAVVHAVPVLRLPAYPRLLPVAALALAMAAARGWDLLLRRSTETRRLAVGFGLAAVLGLAAGPLAPVLAVWALLLGAACVGRWRPRWAGLLLAGALVCDLAPWSLRLLPRGDGGLFFPPSPLIERLRAETLDHGRAAWRVVGMDRLLYPSLPAVYGLADIRPNNVMAPAAYLQVLAAAFQFQPTAENYYAAFHAPDHPLLAFLGVRAVVTNRYLPQPRTLAAIDIAEILPDEVYRNLAALPRWFLPSGIDTIQRQALDDWVKGMSDARRVAVYGDEMRGWQPAPRSQMLPARLLEGVPGHVRLALPGEGERLLATSLSLPTGWRAEAAGRRLATLTVNGAFLGVRVPAGTSELALEFRPPGFATGVAVGLASLALCLALGLPSVGRRFAAAARRHRG